MGFGQALGRAAAELCSSDAGASVFVALVGPLGAGKTLFARGVVRGIDELAAEEVRSPTFAIVDEHPTDPPVYHLDLYRLSGLHDLDGIGYREIYEAPGVVLVEWADRVPEAMPRERIEVVISPDGDLRRFEIEGRGARARSVVERAWT